MDAARPISRDFKAWRLGKLRSRRRFDGEVEICGV
jgi:hypothetical protein